MALRRAHVFVVRDGLILALQQAGGRRWWELPGGDLEAGEDSCDAAVREVFEETGLHLTAAPFLLREWRYRGGRGDEVLAFSYAAHACAGDVRLSEVHSALAWMSVDAYVDAYCSERLDEALPQFREFFAGLRQNCTLFQDWVRAH